MSEQGSHIATLIKPHGYKGEMQMKGKPELLENIQKQSINKIIRRSNMSLNQHIKKWANL